MNKKIDILALGYAGAIVSVLSMVLLGISGNLGIYTGAVEMMTQWHIFFSLSIGGIISGMIEAGIIGFLSFYIFGWMYNKLSK